MITLDFIPSELTFFEQEKNVQNVLASLESENIFLKEKVAYFEAEHEKLLGYIRQLKQEKYGRKADVCGDHQTALLPGFEEIFDEIFEEEKASLEGEEKGPEEETPDKNKKAGRRALPKDLPRRQEIHDLSEEEKICDCGCLMKKIGEEVCEKLEYIPAQMNVLEIIRYKYACKACEEGVKIAKVPLQVIPKGIATPGLLAHVLVSKYADALPLYRQSNMFKRIGIELSRGTLSAWVLACGEILSPLRELLKKEINQDGYVRADETPVQVLQEPHRKDTTKSFMWMYMTGSSENKSIVYDYQETRGGESVEEFLKDFRGYLQSDAYSGYNRIGSIEGNTTVGCWAHARRKYTAIVKMFPDKPGKAAEIVGVIKKLYEIEAQIKERGIPPDEIKKDRQEKAKPILEEFKKQLQRLKLLTPPKNPLAKAIGYTLNNWKALTAYLEDGRLDIDNNAAERAIRPFAIGRKNWLFMGNPEGAKAASTIYSLIETAKANGLEPFKYLKYVFEEIPALKGEELACLLPWNVPAVLKIDSKMRSL